MNVFQPSRRIETEDWTRGRIGKSMAMRGAGNGYIMRRYRYAEQAEAFSWLYQRGKR